MKIYLAGIAPYREQKLYDSTIKKHRPFILESFYYANEDTERLLPYFGDFMLDSGAFTFMQDNSSNLNWEQYLEQYADFINRNKIDKFFELDIDYVIGYSKVLELRTKLEKLTGKQCIPVWHKIRGAEEFKRMCNEYSYVAIGASGKNEDSRWVRTKPELLKKFVDYAHYSDTKIHGLGYTNLRLLPVMRFDSVDSTAWTTGNRFGYVYKFDGKTMKKRNVPEGKRIGAIKEVALMNYKEWIKYQQYMERSC